MHNPKPIKIAMVNKDINSAEELAGVSRPTITKILKGEDVMPKKLEAVLNVLGVSKAEVYTQEFEPALP
jgi:transcriptional regulator with XRE-family HTH domain